MWRKTAAIVIATTGLLFLAVPLVYGERTCSTTCNGVEYGGTCPEGSECVAICAEPVPYWYCTCG
ncbi:MAG: hypothetical protein CMJ18_27085 [Phycisphaeraceae bacterium]|nr:hypothetical protein [Phycisphaeraceae bacterium]